MHYRESGLYLELAGLNTCDRIMLKQHTTKHDTFISPQKSTQWLK